MKKHYEFQSIIRLTYLVRVHRAYEKIPLRQVSTQKSMILAKHIYVPLSNILLQLQLT